MTPPRKSESFESIIAISCERRVQRLKRANNLERKRKRERRGEEWSGPGPVRNVIRPRKLQFPHGPGITARRHKIYPRVRALVGRGSLFNCLSFARIRTFYRGNCAQVFPRLLLLLLLLPSSPPLIRSSCTRIKTTFVSAGFETKVGNIGGRSAFFPVQRFDPRIERTGVNRGISKFSRISSVFEILDSWRD